MKLSDLTCENLDIDFGAGSSEVINVTCKNEADFDLGVGKTVFKDCTFNDSDLRSRRNRLFRKASRRR